MVLISSSERKIMRVTSVVVAIVMGAALAGCRSSAASDGRVQVVASFYPLAEAARQVGGGHVKVTNLTPPGAEPHDLELRSSQAAAIQDAKAVLLMGHGFQPSVEKAARRNRATVTMLDRLPKAVVGNGNDPHVWLDPVLMAQLVDGIRDTLIGIDSRHQADYTAGAATFARQLAALDTAWRTGLAHCQRHEIVTSHAAFGYLASRYGLTQEAIVGLAPDAEPNPGRLAALSDLVRRDHVTTVFTETLVSPKVAQTLAREAGVATAVLNPIEGLTERDQRRGATYTSLMRDNLTKVQSALGCA
jgi:zinc transport system substrate-binding protein